VKVGDLVRIKGLHPDWGTMGLITRIVKNRNGLGQINIFSNGGHRAIPWWKRQDYLEVVKKD